MKINKGYEIIYITLRDNERSLTYSNYLKSINLSAKPFYGFDFRKFSQLHEFKNFSKKKFFDRYGRNPSSSEIGCSLSHFEAVKLSENNCPLIILEDDALLKVDSKVFLKLIELINKNNKYEIVIFGFSKFDEISDYHLNIINPFVPTIKFDNLKYSIGERLIHTTSGALAYYLSPSAKKKISLLKEIYHVADDWHFYSNFGIKIGYIFPTLVIEDLSQKSTLDHNEKYFRAPSSNNIFINKVLKIKPYLIGLFRKIILTLKLFFKLFF